MKSGSSRLVAISEQEINLGWEWEQAEAEKAISMKFKEK